MIDQPEALQHHADDERRLLHRELPADARALAVAERFVRVDRARALALGCEIVRLEDLGALAPHGRIAMKRGQQHDDLRARLDRVFSADHLVLVR